MAVGPIRGRDRARPRAALEQEGTTMTTRLATTFAVAALYLVVQLAALHLLTSLLVIGLF